MPSNYEWGIFFHIVGVFAIGGAIGVTFGTYAMARRAKTVQELRVWGSLGRYMSQYHVIPLLAAELILTGAYLLGELSEVYEWSDGWIGFSTIAVVIATAIGYLVITPRMAAIGAAAGPAPDGPVPGAITEKLNDPVLFGAVHGNLMLMMGIIFNMTTKPGTFASLLILVVAWAIGAAAAYPRYARQQQGAGAASRPGAGSSGGGR
jgi:hypothetical protein